MLGLTTDSQPLQDESTICRWTKDVHEVQHFYIYAGGKGTFYLCGHPEVCGFHHVRAHCWGKTEETSIKLAKMPSSRWTEDTAIVSFCRYWFCCCLGSLWLCAYYIYYYLLCPSFCGFGALSFVAAVSCRSCRSLFVSSWASQWLGRLWRLWPVIVQPSLGDCPEMAQMHDETSSSVQTVADRKRWSQGNRKTGPGSINII